ncbi:molybdenum cofactor sulfurase [Actinobacillus seminis]|uniref:MOSC domain-containing protein n=1 Tax=Actinobacillus seminis TaxID=722 RepID=A0A263HDK9_9PAST|nr:MOSC domain-containing protein [Actinobacillus seminis]OZN24757.1 molybdenum cofactor sulfurase [Actinobacillus seminis]SUU35176.1 MOSC domain-containing protein [Actinobacillus seminis]
MAEVLALKIGLVENVIFADGTILETAIRKRPVDKMVVHELGAEGNEVALKAHHGGVDKALFFMADKTFEKLTALIDKNFDWRNTAIYGENFVVSELDETNVCVGDHYRIGDVIFEVSQPRKPCERLSLNADCANTQKIVREQGLTGWYVRIIQTGTCKKGDTIHLLQRPYPQLNIAYLNQLAVQKPTKTMREDLENTLACDVLAEAFKRALWTQLRRI